MIFANGFKLFLVLAATMCFAACMDIRAVDKDAQDEGTENPSAPAVAPLIRSAPYVEALPRAHAYQVVIPTTNSFGELVIKRMGADKIVQQLVLNVGQSSAIDENVQEGQTYVYEWGSSPDQTQKIEVKIPMDFEIQGEMDLTQKEARPLLDKKRWGRIWFDEKSVLTTQGFDLTLEADEFVFEQATLRSFPAHATAGTGLDGRSGGRIQLKAPKVSGWLQLELRGENGGVGDEGPSTPARFSRTGRSCIDGYCVQEHLCLPGILPTGGQGGRGGRGGASPRVELDFPEIPAFELQVLVEPGSGGRGGAGGAGGVLPPPRIGEIERSVYGDCHGGNQGPEGYPGEPGFFQPVCRRQGGQMQCLR